METIKTNDRYFEKPSAVEISHAFDLLIQSYTEQDKNKCQNLLGEAVALYSAWFGVLPTFGIPKQPRIEKAEIAFTEKPDWKTPSGLFTLSDTETIITYPWGNKSLSMDLNIISSDGLFLVNFKTFEFNSRTNSWTIVAYENTQITKDKILLPNPKKSMIEGFSITDEKLKTLI